MKERVEMEIERLKKEIVIIEIVNFEWATL